MSAVRLPGREQVVVAATLPSGVTAGQFAVLVQVAVERCLSDLLGPVNCAVVTYFC